VYRADLFVGLPRLVSAYRANREIAHAGPTAAKADQLARSQLRREQRGLVLGSPACAGRALRYLAAVPPTGSPIQRCCSASPTADSSLRTDAGADASPYDGLQMASLAISARTLYDPRGTTGRNASAATGQSLFIPADLRVGVSIAACVAFDLSVHSRSRPRR
jgi:hypothetical protein